MSDILNQVLPIIESTPVRWTRMLNEYPADLVNRSPAPGEWSAMECLAHIIDVEKILVVRMKAFMDGAEVFPSFDPNAEGTQLPAGTTPTDLAATFAKMRAESLIMLRQLTTEDIERTSRHASLGVVTVREMLHEWVAHDFSHTVQAEEAMMQPFIEGCGPWHVFFDAHKAKT